jgi:signal recognition particle subunit SRP54
MTKLDGDARGGAALSIKEVTGRPIKFLGMGEKMDALEEFRPQGLASRILGMGDVVGLVKDFEEHVDADKAEEDAMRMLQGRFTLQDFLEQLRTIKKMGSFSSLLEKVPGMSDMLPDGQKVDDKEFVKLEAMVLSMTPEERKRPDLVEKEKSRKKRIARGSGRSEKEVEGLLQRFGVMKQMMSTIGTQPGLLGRLPGFKQMGQLAKMAQAGAGGPAGDMAALFGGGPNPFAGGPAGMRPLAPPPGYYAMGGGGGGGGSSQSSKDKKKKRKQEKQARKRNKPKKRKKRK